MPFVTHHSTRVGIWFMILLLPLQGLGIEIRTCAGSVACTADNAVPGGCCCLAKRQQERSCCCHASTASRCSSDRQSVTCCHRTAKVDTSCQCGIGCSCGNAPSSNPPAVPTRDGDSRTSNAASALMLHAFDTAIAVKSPQQRMVHQLETIQSLSVDRCSTLCRFTL